jgi:hypothetical protein
MKIFLVQLIPSLLILCGLFVAICFFAIASKRLKRGRRNPLTSDLLRIPGGSLRNHVEDLSFDIVGFGLCFMVVPLVFYTQIVTQGSFGGQGLNPYFMALLAMAVSIYMGVRIFKLMRQRNRLRLGMECEMAVGQELNQLMLQGCRVYHDFPAQNFNIDHVVIGPAGVFAVETKGRAKPDKGRGAEDVRVVYDGKSLQFPGWCETEPIAQAQRQAQWLARWLKSAVGQDVLVKPALALPGWYVERKDLDMVVFNSKNPGFLARPKGERVLSDELIQRVAHQVEQRCRTEEPLSYSRKKVK